MYLLTDYWRTLKATLWQHRWHYETLRNITVTRWCTRKSTLNGLGYGSVKRRLSAPSCRFAWMQSFISMSPKCASCPFQLKWKQRYSPWCFPKPPLCLPLCRVLYPGWLTPGRPWPAPTGPFCSKQLLHYIAPRGHITITHFSTITIIIMLSLCLLKYFYRDFTESFTTVNFVCGSKETQKSWSTLRLATVSFLELVQSAPSMLTLS